MRAPGWTYDYGEAPFDRLIRLQAPVELRSALIDPFTPEKVTRIEVQPQSLGPFELPFQAVTSDPLLGVWSRWETHSSTVPRAAAPAAKRS